MTRQRGPDGRFVKVVTASVSTIPTKKLDQLPRNVAGWQERAWRLWGMLGVLHYPTSFMAEQVMRLDWNVEVAGEPIDPEKADEAMDLIAEGIGVDEASRRLALNLEVAGEVFYVRKQDTWNVISASAPKRNELLDGADIVVRGLQSDPVDPTQPDSSVRAGLDVADEIRIIQAQSRSQSRNRASTRGILLYPKETQFPTDSNFQADLEEALVAPTSDEYHPSTATPLVVVGPGDTLEKWRLLELNTAYDDKLQERLDNAIRRLALSLNMPPEVLLGNIDSNHWNAWLSDENTYRGHIEPLALLVGQVFAEAMMQATGQTDIMVLPDPAKLLTRRPSLEDVKWALEAGIVSEEYARRMLGADEDDAPTPEEVERRKPEPVAPQPGPDNMPPDMPAVAASVDPSDEALDALGRRLLDLDTQLLGTLRGEARIAVEAAREKHDTEDVGVQERIAKQMQRLGKAWRRDISDAHATLRELGIDAKGPEWKQAAEVSVHLLVDGMTQYVTENLDKTDSEMPALPTPLLREVLAAAGGSTTATVAAIGGPAPTFQDPQGFAIGVLSLKSLKADDVEIVQWKFRYGQAMRTDPFLPHRQNDGRYMTADGMTSDGFSPGDHKGCLCWMDPVFRRTSVPQEV